MTADVIISVGKFRNAVDECFLAVVDVAQAMRKYRFERVSLHDDVVVEGL